MNKEILEACDQIVAAAANGIYQGVILALVVGLCLRFSRGLNAATRHAIWFATLLLVVALIPAHLLVNRLSPVSASQFPVQAPPPTLKTSPTLAPPVRNTVVTPVPNSPSESDSQFENFRVHLAELSSVGPSPVEDLLMAAPPFVTTPNAASERASSSVQTAPSTVSAGSAPRHNAVAQFVARFLQPLSLNIAADSGLVRNLGLWLLGTWMLVAITRMLCLLWHLYRLWRLKRQATPAAGPVDQLFQSLCTELNVNRPVALGLSTSQRSPILLGFVHPVIILPHSAESSDLNETEHLLRHELAHVLRRDDWANLAQHFLHAAVFFHPAVCWISRQLSLEREIACDDFVLQPGGSRRAYALLLADFAGRIRSAPALLAPGVSANQSQLKQRITMILNTHRNTSPRLAKTRLGFILSTALIAAILALSAGPRLVLAQSPAASSSAAAAISGDTRSPDMAPTAAALPPAPPLAGVLARADVPNQPGVSISPGPKPKPESDDDAPPGALPLIVGPARPMPPVAVAPLVAECPPTDVVKPARPGRRDATSASSKDGDSVERRLERVERMLNSLMAQQNSSKNSFAYSWSSPDGRNFKFDSEKLEADIKRQVAQANEQAKRAMDQAKRAAEQYHHDAEGQEADAQSQKQHAETMRKEALQSQLEAVRKARESLQREVERLDRQIERLQQNQDRKESRQSSAEPGQLHMDIPVGVTVDTETAVNTR
jgi:beta-lactamase regulating signal transducer with metallopeptidase domain